MGAFVTFVTKSRAEEKEEEEEEGNPPLSTFPVSEDSDQDSALFDIILVPPYHVLRCT